MLDYKLASNGYLVGASNHMMRFDNRTVEVSMSYLLLWKGFILCYKKSNAFFKIGQWIDSEFGSTLIIIWFSIHQKGSITFVRPFSRVRKAMRIESRYNERLAHWHLWNSGCVESTVRRGAYPKRVKLSYQDHPFDWLSLGNKNWLELYGSSARFRAMFSPNFVGSAPIMKF